MSAERDALERLVGRGISANGDWGKVWAAIDNLCASERQAGRTEEREMWMKATEELRQGDGGHYITQEAAFAPGIVREWPTVIKHPKDRNGRLVRRHFVAPSIPEAR